MNTKGLSHPRSLRIFFATEMWERYGFYVIQTLLALFLSLHFKWEDKAVYALVGSFTALTYVSPIVGGWIADYLIGQKRAIVVGAIVLLICYVSLTFLAFDQYSISAQSTFGLILTLAGITVGTGMLKPNISSLLGNEYPENSSIREAGFTIFYMGITSGIILGSTLPGILSDYLGWPASFTSAAIGMLIAISIFVFGVYRYKIADYRPFTYQFKKIILAGLLMGLSFVAAFYILRYPAFANSIFILIGFLSLLYFIYTASKETEPQLVRQVWVICLLCVISVMFWALYFQMFLSLTLFIARVVQPIWLNIHFPPPYYVSIQSLGAIVFGFLILAKRKHKASLTQHKVQAGHKFIAAMFFMTIAYIIIAAVCRFTAPDQLVSPLYIIPAYLMISLAELYLYPVGLSAITVLSDRNRVSTMMGIFLVSLGIGGFLSGKLAYLTAVPLEETSIINLKAHYAHAFDQLLYILLSALVLCIFIGFFIKRLLTKAA